MTHEKMQDIVDNLNAVLKLLENEEVYDVWYSHVQSAKEQIIEQFDYECNY